MQKEGSRGGLLDFKKYKKGWSILVRNPCIKGREEGKKQGFVECELGDSLVCHGISLFGQSDGEGGSVWDEANE